MFRAFQQKARFCTNLCEEDVLRLRQSAGLLEDEAVCLLIDDSLFGNRAKNIILTDRRILWQEKRRAPYCSVLLSALKGASVFAGQRGSASVVTILNGGARVSLVFKNVRECEPLQIVFHDYLSRHCEGYNPLDEENVRRYEKEFLLPHRKRDLVSAVLAAGGIFFFVVVLIQQRAVFSRLLEPPEFYDCFVIDGNMLALSLICWAANILLPASKSKIEKSSLLFVATFYFAFLLGAPSLAWEEFGFGLVIAVVFLLADRFDCARLEPMLAVVTAIFGLLMAFAMVYYF